MGPGHECQGALHLGLRCYVSLAGKRKPYIADQKQDAHQSFASVCGRRGRLQTAGGPGSRLAWQLGKACHQELH